MALSFLDNVDYRGRKPNFTRDQFETIEEMVNFSENYLPDTFIATCIEDGKAYLYNRKNELHPSLGKWRLLNPTVEGSSVLTEDITSDIAVGGIKVNKTYITGTSLEEILIDLLTAAPIDEEDGKFYYGLSDDTTADFAIDEIYEVNKPNVLITSHNQYILFIFPADKEISIFDTNGLNNTGSFKVSDFDIEGVAYKVYCSEAKITCVDFEYKIVY